MSFFSLKLELISFSSNIFSISNQRFCLAGTVFFGKIKYIIYASPLHSDNNRGLLGGNSLRYPIPTHPVKVLIQIFILFSTLLLSGHTLQHSLKPSTSREIHCTNFTYLLCPHWIREKYTVWSGIARKTHFLSFLYTNLIIKSDI
jgi:hypothetical protein